MLCIALLITLAYVVARYNTGAVVRPASSNIGTPIRSADLQECVEIIKTQHLSSHGLINVLKMAESRARPNQRLVVAFGVNNCFTTSDHDRCQKFRNQVVPKLKVDFGKWKLTAASVKGVVQNELRRSDQVFNLSAVVRMVTLKSVLHPLLEFDTARVDVDDSIRCIAEEINKQCVRSKDYDKSAPDQPDWAFPNQIELRDALSAVFPVPWTKAFRNRMLQAISTVIPQLKAGEGLENPLNLILPGYETVWRVVLRCFVELTARSHPNATVWSNSLQAFSNNPTRDQLEGKTVAGAAVSASNIAREALRLYPPTRRIHREYQKEDGSTIVVAADIEAMQRDPAAWGEDALTFRPERWQNISYKEGEAPNFLPFGGKPFSCPARQRHGSGEAPFGVSMIALLVGALVAETSGKWEVVGSLPKVGVPLDTDRDAHDDLVLRRLPVLDGTGVSPSAKPVTSI
ncbi:hypothetical protein LTR36_005611 [Oleoguttula mirabilis]|uniref:Cytochrome P450 n=1 Tax=Oleoguttula mirabilis TaxID=1507867 RepID=A0AAV9JEK6_9PEZI|nr:hypothetical protein LTR36_005611 [Oleoguttula mirabilis]